MPSAGSSTAKEGMISSGSPQPSKQDAKEANAGDCADARKTRLRALSETSCQASGKFRRDASMMAFTWSCGSGSLTHSRPGL